MAHKEQLEFCKKVKASYKEFFTGKKILDIGSLNVNGSFKELFTDCNYIGVDIIAGKDVDVVSKGHEYKSKTKFDVVCSGECFEHDEYWGLTVLNMYKLLKKGGLFFFTCASTGRAEHGTRKSAGGLWGTSPDYYKNLTEEDFKKQFKIDELFKLYEFIYNPLSKDLYFWGIKK